jgi:hypothetical protein
MRQGESDAGFRPPGEFLEFRLLLVRRLAGAAAIGADCGGRFIRLAGVQNSRLRPTSRTAAGALRSILAASARTVGRRSIWMLAVLESLRHGFHG